MSRSILVIEDEKPLRESICDILRFEGYNIIEAPDGVQGLSKALRDKPDLILCDIMLPGLNGYEVLKEIRMTDSLRLTPFIFLTALAEKSDIRAGMELGADDYLPKPFRREELLKTIDARIEKLLELEKRDHYMAELESANKDLTDFAYVLSHDLKAPLRLMDMFSQIVLDDYAEKLGVDGKRYLQTIRSNAEKMNRLIDGLLQFSRQRKSEISRTHIKLSSLVKEVIADCLPVGQSHKVSIELGELPDANCDPTMVRQVFVNLISNAIKFSDKKDHPKIEVGVKSENGKTIFFVKDNGVGFNMEYYPKLFMVFQRLHTEAEFAGTGIGLAIVKEIVEKHGGQIWAEAKVNEGATFFFTLP